MIERVGGVGGPQDYQRLEKQKTERAENSASAAEKSDVMVVSQRAKLVKTLQTMPSVRANRVASIKQQVEDGTYYSDAKLEAAIDKLLTGGGISEIRATDAGSYSKSILMEVSFQSYREISDANGTSIINRDAFEFRFKLEYESKPVEAAEGQDVKDVIAKAWSPEATAGRIFDFAVSFYGRYLDNHKSEDTEAVRQEFADMMTKAVDMGFKLAKDITGELPEGVAKIVNETYSIVMDHFKAFVSGDLKEWQLSQMSSVVDPFVQKYDKNYDGALTYSELGSVRPEKVKPEIKTPKVKKQEPAPKAKPEYPKKDELPASGKIDLLQ